MKRWQTRGEVQDSDEEEISLDVEPQRLKHPPKRIKVVEDVEQKDKSDEGQAQARPDARSDGPSKSHAETIEKLDNRNFDLAKKINEQESVLSNMQNEVMELKRTCDELEEVDIEDETEMDRDA